MSKKKRKGAGWKGHPPAGAPGDLRQLVFVGPCTVCGNDAIWPAGFGTIDNRLQVCCVCMVSDLLTVLREAPMRFGNLPTLRALREAPQRTVWATSGTAHAGDDLDPQARMTIDATVDDLMQAHIDGGQP